VALTGVGVHQGTDRQWKAFPAAIEEGQDQWALQSDFDGAELFSRPCIDLINVEPAAIREAESKIAACERWRPEESQIPFDWILADVLGKRGAFEFVLAVPAKCPSCRGAITEKTQVEPQGGIQVESATPL